MGKGVTNDPPTPWSLRSTLGASNPPLQPHIHWVGPRWYGICGGSTGGTVSAVTRITWGPLPSTLLVVSLESQFVICLCGCDWIGLTSMKCSVVDDQGREVWVRGKSKKWLSIESSPEGVEGSLLNVLE